MERKSKILIVDDEPVGRETLEMLLINQGYELTFASDGAETLRLAAEVAPDLILLDVMMPGMNGFEVCRRLRADPVLDEVPVIMVTALDDHDSRLRGIEAGADDFVTKPFNRAELRARVRTITRLNRYQRLLAGRARFGWVIEHAQDGYVIIDDRDQILYANPRACLYLGCEPVGSETLDSPPGGESGPLRFLDLAQRQYHCEPLEAWSDWPRCLDEYQGRTRYLVRPESATATSFWLQVDVLEMPAGTSAEWLVHMRDVTAEVAQQRDIRGFHEVISHKLRTPLTSMLVSLELIIKRGERLAPEDILAFSQSALRSAHRLHNTVESIIKYLNVRQVAKRGASFNLGQLEAVIDEIGTGLDIPSVLVSGAVGLEGVHVPLPRQGIELMLWELLDNARKFHPEQRPQVEIEVRHTPGQVCLRVIDDGISISPQHMEQIWIPYYQGEKYFTGEAQGMGLGLAVVSTLVWGIGGTCSVRNRTDGAGVIVDLVLPVEDKIYGQENENARNTDRGR
jgi:two-component system cell cycle response regulator